MAAMIALQIILGICIGIAAILLPWYVPNRFHDHPIVVDIAEHNALTINDGSVSIQQLILWRRYRSASGTAEMHVAEWFRLKDPIQISRRQGPLTKLIVMRDGKQQVLYAREFRETMTSVDRDPEQMDAKHFPKDRRVPYFK